MRFTRVCAATAITVFAVGTLAPVAVSAYEIDRSVENCRVVLTDAEQDLMELHSPIELVPSQIPRFQYDLQSENRRLRAQDTSNAPQWAVDYLYEGIEAREMLVQDLQECASPAGASTDQSRNHDDLDTDSSGSNTSNVLAVLGIIGGITAVVAAFVAIASAAGFLDPLL